MTSEVLRLKISLLDTKVWREVVVPAGFSLAQLHSVIQLSMGWEDCHLHGFFQGRSALEPKTRLADVLGKVGAKLLYTYDYGDSWDHEVKLLAHRPLCEGEQVPGCTRGALACPPEDCGGVPGYAELCELLERDDLDEDEQERMAWAEGWKPADFVATDCNRARAKKFKLKAAKS